MRTTFGIVMMTSLFCMIMGISLYTDSSKIAAEAEELSVGKTATEAIKDQAYRNKMATVFLVIISTSMTVASLYILMTSAEYENFKDWRMNKKEMWEKLTELINKKMDEEKEN